MRIKIKPKEFDYEDWGIIIKPKTDVDLSIGAILLAENQCSKSTEDEMYAIIIIVKELYNYSIELYPSIILLDNELEEDEYYILCQNLDGSKKMTWHSTGA